MPLSFVLSLHIIPAVGEDKRRVNVGGGIVSACVVFLGDSGIS